MNKAALFIDDLFQVPVPKEEISFQGNELQGIEVTIVVEVYDSGGSCFECGAGSLDDPDAVIGLSTVGAELLLFKENIIQFLAVF